MELVQIHCRRGLHRGMEFRKPGSLGATWPLATTTANRINTVLRTDRYPNAREAQHASNNFQSPVSFTFHSTRMHFLLSILCHSPYPGSQHLSLGWLQWSPKCLPVSSLNSYMVYKSNLYMDTRVFIKHISEQITFCLSLGNEKPLEVVRIKFYIKRYKAIYSFLCYIFIFYTFPLHTPNVYQLFKNSNHLCT